MQRPLPQTFATFVAAPENRAALAAVERLLEPARGRPHPLFLHGPAGTGKTHLVAALAERLVRLDPTRIVTLLPANEWNALAGRDAGEEPFAAVRSSDLLVVEDLQHLSARGGQALEPLLDELGACRVPVVCTATVGPRRLELPERLVSRLTGGLVVGLEPLQAASRLLVLQDKAQRRQLAVSPAVLAWVADHVHGGRQLDGALVRLEALARASSGPLDVPTVAAFFEQAPKPSVEKVAQKVGNHFRVDLRHLRSERRGRHILWPRQVGMYLARQLTGLSLGQIGDYFGGRDHSTVLHACRKVERALSGDAVVSGTVRQLYLELA